jgi:hypothetical protein
MKKINLSDEKVHTKDLIVNTRIDLVVGIDYVDSYERKLETNFLENLYIEHKKSWNDLKDGVPGGEVFEGKEDFLKRFNSIIESIKIKKTNLVKIPLQIVNGRYWLGNGFHRVSALHYFGYTGKYTLCDQTSGCAGRPVDINFFAKGLSVNNSPLASEHCNYIMMRFLESYFKKYSCIVLFPNKRRLPEEIENAFNKDIVFELAVSAEANFAKNFIELLYIQEDWAKKNSKIKASDCFFEQEDQLHLRILFIKQYSNEKLKKIKNCIREYYKIGNHSVHTPDAQIENQRLSRLFNENTISFLKYTPTLFNNFDSFEKCLKNLKSFCENNKIDTRRICVTSSAVLSVYCLRDCGDIDLLVDEEYIDIFKNSPFDTHNSYANLGHYETTSDDIIYNPQNHFYYDEIKFCILEIIYNYKQYRIQNNLFGEASLNKDKADIKLIENSKKFKEKWY